MAEHSTIEWTDHTFNPWLGCTALSPACDFCYAEAWSKRTGNAHLWQGERRRTTAALWQGPLKWNARCAAAGIRERVFCASLADVFDNQVPSRWRDDLWHRIDQCRSLDWMLLTKRPENIAKMLPTEAIGAPLWGAGWPHVWLGTTIEDRARLRRLDHLRRVPAAVRFLSCEPLLEDLGDLDLSGIHLVIGGGESGPHARITPPEAARSLRDVCAAQRVPFFWKRHGEWIAVEDLRRLPGGTGPGFGVFDHCRHDLTHGMVRVGKKAAGRLLDGVTHDAMPEVRR